MIDLTQFPDYAQEHVQKWIKKISDSGKELPKLNELQSVADWLHALPEENPKMVNKLYKLNWPMAIQHQEKWHEQMIKRLSKAKQFIGNPNDIKVIKELPNDMKWVEVLTPEGKDYEGDAMGHCVGKGSYDDAIIYSLRDKNNLPHCTINYTVDKFPYSGPAVPQVQGRANKEIAEKYQDMIKEFIIDDLKVQPENINDPEKFGYQSFIFEYNPEKEVPKEFLKIKDTLHTLDNKSIYNYTLSLTGNIDYIPYNLGEHTLLNITDATLPKQVNFNAFKPIFIKNVSNMKELQITVNDFTISELPDLETCIINKIPQKTDIEDIYFEKISIYSLPELKTLSISDEEPCSISSLSLSHLPKLNQINGNIKEITSLFIENLPEFKKFNQNIICHDASFLQSNIEDISNITFKGNVDIRNCQNLKDLYHKEWKYNLYLYNCGVQEIESNSYFNGNVELVDNVKTIGDNVTVMGNFYYRVRDESKSIQSIGNNFHCNQNLILNNTNIEHIGSNLYVRGFLSLHNSKLSELKNANINSLLAEDSSLRVIENVTVNNNVKLTNSPYLEKIPDNWSINSLEVSNCYALDMPDNLTVQNNLQAMNCFSALKTGKNLTVSGNAYFLDCESLEEVSDGTYVEGVLNLNGCSELNKIGHSVKVNDLILNGCHNLKELPDDLEAKTIILPNGDPCESVEVAKKWFKEKFPKNIKKQEMSIF